MAPDAIRIQPEVGLVHRAMLRDARRVGIAAILLRRLGHTAEARDAYLRALGLVNDDAERGLIERRLAELDRSTGPARP